MYKRIIQTQLTFNQSACLADYMSVSVYLFVCVCVFQQIAPLSRAVLFVDERKAAEEEAGAAAATGVSSSTDEAEEAMDDALPFHTVSYRALQSIDRSS